MHSLKIKIFLSLVLGFGCCFCAGSEGASHIPSWWFERGILTTTLEEETSDAGMEGNYIVANVGQLMHVAEQATLELEQKQPGATPASAAIRDLVDDFLLNNTPNPNNPDQNFDLENNYAVLNIGQLKFVVSLFYDRLWELPEGVVTWPDGMTFLGGNGKYPWADLPEPSDANYDSEIEKNYMAANLGQVKYLFSWSLDEVYDPEDTDRDGIKDWWEYKHFGNLDTADGNSCYNGDGIRDIDKFRDPLQPDPTLPPADSGLELVLYTPLERFRPLPQ